MTTPTEPDPRWNSQVEGPDISHIEIEDDQPVDNMYSEKQQRLLTESLYSSWPGPRSGEGGYRPFLATANVGVFATAHDPPLVPDVLVSVDVSVHPDAAHEKKHQTYFLWEMGKAPDVVIEVVSNKRGGELGKRKRGYERMGVPYFVVWDPERLLRERELMAYAISPSGYIPMTTGELSRLDGLSLRPWEGAYEGMVARWLRWFEGETLVATGSERANAEQQRADTEQQRADTEQQRADTEQQRADAEQQRADAEQQRADAEQQRANRLAALLAAHGLSADS